MVFCCVGQQSSYLRALVYKDQTGTETADSGTKNGHCLFYITLSFSARFFNTKKRANPSGNPQEPTEQ